MLHIWTPPALTWSIAPAPVSCLWSPSRTVVQTHREILVHSIWTKSRSVKKQRPQPIVWRNQDLSRTLVKIHSVYQPRRGVNIGPHPLRTPVQSRFFQTVFSNDPDSFRRLHQPSNSSSLGQHGAPNSSHIKRQRCHWEWRNFRRCTTLIPDQTKMRDRRPLRRPADDINLLISPKTYPATTALKKSANLVLISFLSGKCVNYEFSFLPVVGVRSGGSVRCTPSPGNVWQSLLSSGGSGRFTAAPDNALTIADKSGGSKNFIELLTTLIITARL